MNSFSVPKRKKNVWIIIVGLPLILSACSILDLSPLSDISASYVSTTTATLPPTETITPTITPSFTPESSPTPVNVSEFPDPSGYTWSEMITNLKQPVGLVSAGDGSGRLFVLERRGRILIFDGESLLDNPFLDIRGRIGSNGSEQGLLGLAFHPDFETNGYFYINYTNNTGDTVVSRFLLSSDPNQGDGDSEFKLMTISQPYKNHNGGQIRFGPQGYLWIASGDGGSGGDPQNNAQNVENLLGKLLRIDIDQQPYAIPPENPFGNEIWAYGLRNPWRFTFDPADGDLFVADVGQNLWEEISYLAADAPAGANFGWDYLEGSHPFEGSPPESLVLTDPLWEYDHNLGCSVSGGAVYRGSMLEWQGIYLYGDFCSGMVWGLLQSQDGQWQNQLLFQVNGKIAAIDQDENGEVYLVDLEGSIFKLIMN